MNGIIVIDKPGGRTSRAVVEEVRKTLGIRKAGHTGTLDPLATGVLPVCLGEATKLVQFLALDDKEYRVTLLLGVRTDTLDTDGAVVAREEPRVTREQVEAVLKGLTGRREQAPPRYSAVKFQGRALYDWTRRGIDVEAPAREVEVYRIGIGEFRLPEVTFTVSCSKGTYIRSLCAEAGEILGCGGCMSALRRTRSGCFSEGQALSLEGGTEAEKRSLWSAHRIPMEETLPGLASIDADPALAGRLRNGCQPDGEALARHHIPFLAAGDVVKFKGRDGQLVAIGRMLRGSEELASGEEGKKQAVRILRVFND